MTLRDALHTRRSTPAKQLEAPGPDAATLDDMLRIASRVPDHGKLAPWRFVVIDAQAGARLGETVEAAFVADRPDASEEERAVERGRFTRAPVTVAVVSCAAPHPKIPEWEQVLSAGAACLNLLLAAEAHGFGASWITEWVAYDRRILDALGLSPHEKVAGYVHVGTPRMRMSDRPRPELAAIVTRL
ncbi:nitroreductase family protein [Salinarimonas ramus]|uniref:Putative NAD(P)H nitroreductase n=1 Tax=Salinarimonas ramus TaxID=690164 RepID=A0A917QL09_9HYPH|nr:nitroreductase [Salinarimonas ramus]GGK54239.1 nitroreductase [Salinarimonas ramus]